MLAVGVEPTACTTGASVYLRPLNYSAVIDILQCRALYEVSSRKQRRRAKRRSFRTSRVWRPPRSSLAPSSSCQQQEAMRWPVPGLLCEGFLTASGLSPLCVSNGCACKPAEYASQGFWEQISFKKMLVLRR